MKRAMIVGGSNGIGMASALELATMCEAVTIVDRVLPNIVLPNNIAFKEINLINNRFEFLLEYDEIDTLIITAGFGRVTRFENITDKENQLSTSENVRFFRLNKIFKLRTVLYRTADFNKKDYGN